MGRLFSDATPEQEQAFIEERRKFQFLAAWQWPISWLIPARRHKQAADILYEIAYEANERELSQFLAKAKERRDVNVAKILEGQDLIDSQNMELLGDYFLLSGYAIECVRKGYLLALRPEIVKNKKQLEKIIITHDLCKLCKSCDFTLSQEEQDLLQLLTHHIIWGKYPAPKKIGDMLSWVDIEDDKKKSLSIENPYHERRAQSIINGVFQRGFDLLNDMRSSPAATNEPNR